MPLITLVVGDWSHDGHGMCDKILIQSNADVSKIEAGYRAGTAKLGFDFCEEVASDYEDGRIHLAELKKLRDAGFKRKLEDEHTEEEAKATAKEFEKYGRASQTNWEYWAGGCLDPETYCEIYQFIVQLGDPLIVFTPIEHGELRIGGYGLFSK